MSQAVVTVMAKICLLFAAAHALSNPPLMQEHWTSSLPNLRLIVRFVFLSGGHLQFHGRCSYLFRRNHWPCADVSGRIQQVSYSLKSCQRNKHHQQCMPKPFLPAKLAWCTRSKRPRILVSTDLCVPLCCRRNSSHSVHLSLAQ